MRVLVVFARQCLLHFLRGIDAGKRAQFSIYNAQLLAFDVPHPGIVEQAAQVAAALPDTLF